MGFNENISGIELKIKRANARLYEAREEGDGLEKELSLEKLKSICSYFEDSGDLDLLDDRSDDGSESDMYRQTLEEVVHRVYPKTGKKIIKEDK